IREHRKRPLEYLGFKEENITQGKSVNNIEVPPIIVESKIPQALEELGESSK
ncbi:hypothetical protein KI387_027510, partial [Taxus chinensis]